MLNVRNGSKGGIRTRAHLIASPAFCRWAKKYSARVKYHNNVVKEMLFVS